MPMMFDIVTPNIPLMMDSLELQKVSQTVGFIETFVFPGTLTTDKGDKGALLYICQGFTLEISDIGKRIIVISVHIAIPTANHCFQIIPAG